MTTHDESPEVEDLPVGADRGADETDQAEVDTPDRIERARGWTKKKWTFTRPEPISGADLQEAFDARVEKHREKVSERERRPADEKGRRKRRIVGSVLGLALLASGVLSGVNTSSFEREKSAGTNQIEKLRIEISKTEVEPAVSKEDLLAVAQGAQRVADQVRDKQNTFAELAVDTNADAQSDEADGSPTDSLMAFVEHRRSLAPYWEPDSLLVDDDEAYAFTTHPVFDHDRMDPRYPWYVRYEDRLASDADEYGWEVETVTPQLDDLSTARVVWVNRETSGVTLAWASATYDSTTEKLSNLELVTTAEGLSHQRSGGDEPEVTVPEMDEDKEKTRSKTKKDSGKKEPGKKDSGDEKDGGK